MPPCAPLQAGARLYAACAAHHAVMMAAGLAVGNNKHQGRAPPPGCARPSGVHNAEGRRSPTAKPLPLQRRKGLGSMVASTSYGMLMAKHASGVSPRCTPRA